MSEVVGAEWEAADILDRVSTVDQTNRALAAEPFVNADCSGVDAPDDISA